MALMNVNTFKGFADRMAKQYSYVKTAFDALSNSASGTQYYDRLTGSDDPDVELAMLSSAYNADNYFENRVTNVVVGGMTEFTALISAFESHLSRVATLPARTWDAYCTDQDVRVSDYTNQVHYSRKNTWMKARNVFTEDDVTFASANMTDGTTLVFTDDQDLGDGASGNYADGTAFAGTQIKAVITGSNTIAGLVVDIVGLDETGVAKTMTSVTVSGAPGDEVVIGTVDDRWVDITSVTRVSGGSTGDQFELHNIKERDITL